MYQPRNHSLSPAVIVIAALVVVGMGIAAYKNFSNKEENNVTHDAPDSKTVTLNESQLKSITIESVGMHQFPSEKKAVGSVAYHEQDGAAITKLLVANVAESDAPFIHAGQRVTAKLSAYPDHVFEGKVAALGGTIWDSGGNPAVDPNVRRITVRCKIADPQNKLYPGMFADITIQVQAPVESVAVPVNAVVRKGDGSMTVWVTNDRQHFAERTVTVGLEHDGIDQILDGLRPDELVVTDGAIFVSNMLYAPPSD